MDLDLPGMGRAGPLAFGWTHHLDVLGLAIRCLHLLGRRRGTNDGTDGRCRISIAQTGLDLTERAGRMDGWEDCVGRAYGLDGIGLDDLRICALKTQILP